MQMALIGGVGSQISPGHGQTQHHPNDDHFRIDRPVFRAFFFTELFEVFKNLGVKVGQLGQMRVMVKQGPFKIINDGFIAFGGAGGKIGFTIDAEIGNEFFDLAVFLLKTQFPFGNFNFEVFEGEFGDLLGTAYGFAETPPIDTIINEVGICFLAECCHDFLTFSMGTIWALML